MAKAKKKSAKKSSKKPKVIKKSSLRKATKKKAKSAKKAKPARSVKKKKVTFTPKGYHSVTPYLIVSNAANAIEFYKIVFAAKEVMRMEKPGGKIGHAELKIGDAKIMLADEFPEMNANSPSAYGGSPITIHLYINNVDRIVERAVSAGAKLISPVSNQFYGDRSGMIEDPYGHKWSIATHVEDVSLREMRKRSAQMFVGQE